MHHTQAKIQRSTMLKEDLDLFNAITTTLLEAEQNSPVTSPIPTQELWNRLDLSLEQDPAGEERFKAALEQLVLSTPRTASHQFFNQLYGGRKSKAILGDLLAVMLNNSMYTYKVAGPMVGVEKTIIREIGNLIGFPETAGGTIASGGSMTNFMAMVMARDAFNKNIRHEGVSPQLTVYTSKESHYSIPKNASFIGVGRNQVRYINTNAKGEMDVDHLKAVIKEDIEAGYHPFMVNATAGTTVLGAFDPIEAISEVTKNYNLWLHVDGAYCGSVIFSENYKHLIKGLEHADSFSVNAHKMLSTPLTCSVIISKDKQHLYDSFSNDADYLFQTETDDFNLGKTSLQCGRRNDALKFWTLWKAVGTRGLADIVEHQFEMADVAREYVRNNADYELISYDNSISICFSYKDFPAIELADLLNQEAASMVSYGTRNGKQFIRLVTINSVLTKEDVLQFFKNLEAVAEKHYTVMC